MPPGLDSKSPGSPLGAAASAPPLLRPCPPRPAGGRSAPLLLCAPAPQTQNKVKGRPIGPMAFLLVTQDAPDRDKGHSERLGGEERPQTRRALPNFPDVPWSRHKHRRHISPAHIILEKKAKDSSQPVSDRPCKRQRAWRLVGCVNMPAPCPLWSGAPGPRSCGGLAASSVRPVASGQRS